MSSNINLPIRFTKFKNWSTYQSVRKTKSKWLASKTRSPKILVGSLGIADRAKLSELEDTTNILGAFKRIIRQDYLSLFIY